MIVQIYNPSSGIFENVTANFEPLELDVEIDITSGHTVEYSGASFEVSNNVYTFQNGQYIVFRDGSNYLYSGYVENLKLDTKRNIYSFDVRAEINRLKSHRIKAWTAPGLTIQDKLSVALKEIQTYLVHEQFDQYTLSAAPTASWWENGVSSTRWVTDNSIDGHMKTPISLFTNNSADDNTDMVMRFTDVVNGKVIIQIAFFIQTGGGNAQSLQIKIGNGSIAGNTYAAYITFDTSDFFIINGNGLATVFQRGRWQVMRIELDVDTRLFDTYLNDNLIDSTRNFYASISYIDMIYFNCQWNGISTPANFWVDSIKVGIRPYLDNYEIVAMDSIAQQKLDLDDFNFPGLDDLFYLGDNIQGTNGKNYHCTDEHQSEVFNQPVTGNAFQNYWDNLYKFTVNGLTLTPEIGVYYTNNSVTLMVRDTNISGGSGTLLMARVDGTNNPNTTGTLTAVFGGGGDATISYTSWEEISGSGSWEENKQYGRSTFNDLLVDCLRLMNGHANQHYVICHVVNHQIRFYGFSETWTPSALAPTLLKEFIEDKTGEQFIKYMDADELRGSGSINHPNNYQLKCWKWEHEMEYAEVLEFLDFRTYNGIRGLITSMSIRKSVHEYVLTEIQNLGIL